ncbi:MAG: hypothetical protein E7376_03475 [Clostridiales bacterium]|nr:hypothetical protein [Clostridiales bacterium]
MNNFYIFLDIDGVMYDWTYIKSHTSKQSKLITNFNPQSVFALNYLINNLSKIFNVVLVITSTWRKDMQKCKNILLKNGVKLNNLSKLTCTNISQNQHLRGEEIVNYLKENSINLNNNYVIIDDEMFDYLSHFSKTNIIHTNIFNNSLNISQINEFLNNFNNLLEK